MPTLSSFLSSNQYTKENTTKPLLAGIQLGSAYAGVTFNGVSGAPGNDPGGLFGWLIYSRKYKYTPAKGTTGDKYIAYTNPQDLVGDLNKLSGITSFMVSGVSAGGTYGLFQQIGTSGSGSTRKNELAPTSIGYQFLDAIHHMAYGGTVVVVGTTAGLSQYQNDKDINFDIVLGQTASSDLVQWVEGNDYTTGVFPSINNGSGYTLANYDSLFGNTGDLADINVTSRYFNVYGTKTITNADTSTLLTNSRITYSIPAVFDAGGFFARSKNANELYLTIAGTKYSKVINGTISNAIEWSDDIKDTFRTNRVNFFVNGNGTQQFMGSDLVGVTANTAISAEDRIGVSKLKSAIRNDLTQIGMTYLFEPNDAATRSLVTSKIKTAISKYSNFIFTQATQIICDSTNNTDYNSTLTMTVIVQPILALDSFDITVNIITS